MHDRIANSHSKKKKVQQRSIRRYQRDILKAGVQRDGRVNSQVFRSHAHLSEDFVRSRIKALPDATDGEQLMNIHERLEYNLGSVKQTYHTTNLREPQES